MRRCWQIVRWLVLIGILAAAYYVVKRALLKGYEGSEPIPIGAERVAVTFAPAFPNLEFERPIGLTFPLDGTNRVAVISQLGSVYIFPNEPSVKEPAELLNIRKQVAFHEDTNEEGLLGLAFHPKFRDNQQFFLYYTTNEHVNVVSRFTVSADDPNRADPGTEVEIFRGPKKGSWNHNGGTIVFGPDDYLYIAVGDGGPTGDPQGMGQNTGTVLGKILRIDVDHEGAGLHYAIPRDNPFVGVPAARGEIWALGLRNVWRMAFDRKTKRLWAGDVGDDTWEEVNIIERGGNYGWSIYEGFHKFTPKNGSPRPPQPDQIVGKLIDPLFAYNHSVGNCIIGGCVYRGKVVPALDGAYLFADHVTGNLYALRCNDAANAVAVAPIQPASMPVFSFGEDEAGEVYFTTTRGVINRIVPAAAGRPK